jgi:hypothetical protein
MARNSVERKSSQPAAMIGRLRQTQTDLMFVQQAFSRVVITFASQAALFLTFASFLKLTKAMMITPRWISQTPSI